MIDNKCPMGYLKIFNILIKNIVREECNQPNNFHSLIDFPFVSGKSIFLFFYVPPWIQHLHIPQPTHSLSAYSFTAYAHQSYVYVQHTILPCLKINWANDIAIPHPYLFPALSPSLCTFVPLCNFAPMHLYQVLPT